MSTNSLVFNAAIDSHEKLKAKNNLNKKNNKSENVQGKSIGTVN